jgi:hypothetical protein
MRRGIIAALFITAVGVTACAYYDDYALAASGRYAPYGYDGAIYAGYHGPTHFTGDGAAVLDPWLAHTAEGRRLVSSRFDASRDGRIGDETARLANAWFRRQADADRDMRLTDKEIRLALARAGGETS